MRWWPRSEDELARALREGLLSESHHVDLKREPASGKAANKAMAVDMACLAVDGGILVYGADEQSRELHPFDFSGFREHVDQVARSLVDEPLPVRIEEIASTTDPGKGYVIVIVPESPSSPHMVDGRYRGRGDTTNIRFSDSEVVRLHTRRQQHDREAEEVLRNEMMRDPTPEDKRVQGHLFVVAEPMTGRGEMLLEALEGIDATQWIMKNLIRGRPSSELTEGWSPDLGIVSRVGREAEGWVAHSGYMGPGRTILPEGDEDDLLHLEFRENGGVRLFCGRGSDSHPNSPSLRVVFEPLIAGLTLRTILMASVISEVCGHFGNWTIGLGISNLQGCVSWRVTQNFLGNAVPYSSAEYIAATMATRDAVDQDPRGVMERVFARLNRGLNGGSVPVIDLRKAPSS